MKLFFEGEKERDHVIESIISKKGNFSNDNASKQEALSSHYLIETKSGNLKFYIANNIADRIKALELAQNVYFQENYCHLLILQAISLYQKGYSYLS